MILARRHLIASGLAFLAAPAIVRTPGLLMPVPRVTARAARGLRAPWSSRDEAIAYLEQQLRKNFAMAFGIPERFIDGPNGALCRIMAEASVDNHILMQQLIVNAGFPT